MSRELLITTLRVVGSFEEPAVLNTAPARTSATRWGVLTARHRVCADPMRLNAIARPGTLAAGLLIVASDLAGFREVLDDGQLGLLGPPRNEQARADAIIRMLADDRLRGRLTQAGREKACTLAWPVVAERILEVYGAAWRLPVQSNLAQPAVAA